MRYTLAWGESVFVGWRKLSWLIPIWFIFSTFIPWSLPGFSSASSAILAHYLGVQWELPIALFLLALTGVFLSLGRTLYRTMELFQRTVILIGLPFMFILAAILTKRTDWIEAAWGLVGQGDGYSWFPAGIALSSFLGAFAYSGGGGNLNLAQSYYIKEKGWGMGAHAAKITSLFSEDKKQVSIEGRSFADTPANERLWRKWWWLVNVEHWLVFWLLGFVTIVVLAVMSYALVHGQAVGGGLDFLYAEAAAIGDRTIPLVGTFFMLVAALTLFSTQVGVLESSSRIISENLLLVFHKGGSKVNLSLSFYMALWGQILLGMIVYVSGFREPRILLTLGAVLNAAAMMVAFPLLFWLNAKSLPKKYQPGLLRKLLVVAGFVFFAAFVSITAQDFFKW